MRGPRPSPLDDTAALGRYATKRGGIIPFEVANATRSLLSPLAYRYATKRGGIIPFEVANATRSLLSPLAYRYATKRGGIIPFEVANATRSLLSPLAYRYAAKRGGIIPFEVANATRSLFVRSVDQLSNKRCPAPHRTLQAGRDSNPQPLVLETSALPIELPTYAPPARALLRVTDGN